MRLLCVYDKLTRKSAARAAMPERRVQRKAGFTLIELIIVMTIISILASIAVGHYFQTVTRAHEAALHQDLFVMRDAIQKYTLDKEAGPQSLDDLAREKYISEVPTDPITRQKNWHTETCDTTMSPEQTTIGICDVHSGSDDISPFENTPYSSW